MNIEASEGVVLHATITRDVVGKKKPRIVTLYNTHILTNSYIDVRDICEMEISIKQYTPRETPHLFPFVGILLWEVCGIL